MLGDEGALALDLRLEGMGMGREVEGEEDGEDDEEDGTVPGGRPGKG